MEPGQELAGLAAAVVVLCHLVGVQRLFAYLGHRVSQALHRAVVAASQVQAFGVAYPVLAA